jgi:hypothetical protein
VHLEAAREDGRLLDMPRRDWAPHDARPRRVLAEDRDRQAVTLRSITGATRFEAGLLLALVKSESVSKHGYTSPKAVDVHVLNLRRRLAPLGIAIICVHGYGYRLRGEDRHRLANMIEGAR